jgi:hypothetical protein
MYRPELRGIKQTSPATALHDRGRAINALPKASKGRPRTPWENLPHRIEKANDGKASRRYPEACAGKVFKHTKKKAVEMSTNPQPNDPQKVPEHVKVQARTRGLSLKVYLEKAEREKTHKNQL